MGKVGHFTFLMLSGTTMALGGLVLDARPLRFVPIASHWIVLAGLLVASAGLVCLSASSIRRAAQPSADRSRCSPWLRLANIGVGTVAMLTFMALGVLVRNGKEVVAEDFLVHGRGPECCMGSLTRTTDGKLAIFMADDVASEVTKYSLDSSPSAEQLKAAVELYEKTATAAVKFQDYNYVKSKGGYTISNLEVLGREKKPFEHLFNPNYMSDGRILDPERPESLMFYQDRPREEKRLVGVMYMMPPGQSGPQIGGPLTRWHYHSRAEFCSDNEGIPRVKADPYPKCPAGMTTRTPEMLHLWLVDNPGGVFSHMMEFSHGMSGHDMPDHDMSNHEHNHHGG